MNEFTKEELKCLFSALYTIECFHNQKESSLLLIKIQSLIDNYDEHEHTWNRLSMLSGKDYDFCEGCMTVRRVR